MSTIIAEYHSWLAFTQACVAVAIGASITLTAGLGYGAEPTVVLNDVPTKCLALSVDGKTCAVGGADANGAVIEWFETTRWQRTEKVSMRGECVRALTFASDSKLCFAAIDVDIVVINAADRKETTCWKRHDDYVNCIVRSPDGRLLASSGADGRVCLWNAEDLSHMRDLDGFAGSIFALSFDASGRKLVAAGRDIFRVWATLKKGRCEDVPFNDSAFDVCFSPKGDFVFAATDAGFMVQADVAHLTDRPKAFRLGSSLAGLVFVDETGESALVGAGRDLVVFDIGRGKVAKTLHRSAVGIRGMTYDPTGKWLAVATWGRTVEIWRDPAGLRIGKGQE